MNPITHFIETLKKKVLDAFGKDWEVSPKREISKIDDNMQINCFLYIQSLKNLEKEYKQRYTFDYSSAVPMETQISLAVGQIKDYAIKDKA